jgi:hypothetical protein
MFVHAHQMARQQLESLHIASHHRKHGACVLIRRHIVAVTDIFLHDSRSSRPRVKILPAPTMVSWVR